VNGLKLSFFALDYLQNLKRIDTDPTSRSNALRGSAQTSFEQTFIENFWKVVNPRLLALVNNAFIYDILLLLIYNVSSPLNQTSQALGEFLVKHYAEEEQFNL